MADGKSGVAVGDATIKKPRDRSPAYPALSLKEAIEKLASYDSYFKRHPAPNDKAGLAWGYKEKSSQAYSALAAMKAFGLIEYGEDRTSTLTEDGRIYLRAQQDSVKKAILQKCALQPKSIAAYWSKWGADRPRDPIALDELVMKGSFAESGAPLFLKVYDETIAYAGLSNSDKLMDNGEIKGDSTFPLGISVGDNVKWECGGVIQFDSRRVTEIAKTKDYVFVEGSSTGIPIQEVTIVETNKDAKAPPIVVTPPIRPAQPGARQDVFSLEEGQVILQWPAQLSAESYEDFESWIQLQLRKIKRSIN